MNESPEEEPQTSMVLSSFQPQLSSISSNFITKLSFLKTCLAKPQTDIISNIIPSISKKLNEELHILTTPAKSSKFAWSQ